MDSEQHARFLDYLETFDYFARPGLVRLTREEFQSLDALYYTLKAQTRLTVEEGRKLAELRVLLLLD